MALLQYLVHLLPGQLWQDRVQLVDAFRDCGQGLLFHSDEVQFEDSDREELGDVLRLHLLLFEVGQQGAEELDLWVLSQVGLKVGCLVGLEVFPGLVKVVEVVGPHVKRLLQRVRDLTDLVLGCQVVFQDILPNKKNVSWIPPD